MAIPSMNVGGNIDLVALHCTAYTARHEGTQTEDEFKVLDEKWSDKYGWRVSLQEMMSGPFRRFNEGVSMVGEED